jgi:hypothetical protein
MDGFFRETLSQTYLDNIKKILRPGHMAASLRQRISSKGLKFRILSGEIQGFTCERDYYIMAYLSKRKRDLTAEEVFPPAKKQAASFQVNIGSPRSSAQKQISPAGGQEKR